MAHSARIKTGIIIVVVVALVAALWFIAAPQFIAGRGQGVIEIHIKDHRDAIGDFARLDIMIDKISVSPRPGLLFWRTDWRDLTPSTSMVDLTRYVGKETARVFRGASDAGVFDAFHVRIKSIDAVLKNKAAEATVKNTLGPVAIPFEVTPNGETVLVLDLVVTDFSDHPPRGYELGIKGYEIFTNGKPVAKIPPA